MQEKKSTDNKCMRVTRREQKIARSRANSLLVSVRRDLRQHYRMEFRIAGSGCWGTMVKDPNGDYDLDYQIILTHNSPDFKNKENEDEWDPGIIKKNFMEAFENNAGHGEKFENSTTAITLKNDAEEGKHFSIDFVIMFRNSENGMYVIRRSKNSSKGSSETYVWNQLRYRFGDLYKDFRTMNPDEKRKIVDAAIRKKCIEKRKPDGKPSCAILLEEIENYVRHREVHNRL